VRKVEPAYNGSTCSPDNSLDSFFPRAPHSHKFFVSFVSYKKLNWRIIRLLLRKNMTHSANSSLDRARRFSALLGLFAILLIYAPIASATFMAVSGACCTGDQCPIHGNHHPAKNNSNPKNDSAAMDCGHEQHSAKNMRSCSVSCCHSIEQSATHANIYLLTPVSVTTGLALNASASTVASDPNISPSFAPLAPPPKSHLS